MLYVGVDAHQETSRITVMDEGGQVLKRTRVATTRAAVQEVLMPYRRGGVPGILIYASLRQVGLWIVPAYDARGNMVSGPKPGAEMAEQHDP